MDNKQNTEPTNTQPPQSTTIERTKHKPKFMFGYIVLIILVVALAGVYVWQHKKVTSLGNQLSSSKTQTNSLQKQVSSLQTTIKQNNSIVATASYPLGDISYLDITQWGIKVRFTVADASLVTYTYSSTGSDSAGPGDGAVSLELKSSVTKDPSCQDLGIGIVRHLVSSYDSKDQGGSPTSVVGKYYYMVGGSPYSCGNSLLDDIRANYVGNNPYTWVYLDNN
jgi:cell division protein FtsL